MADDAEKKPDVYMGFNQVKDTENENVRKFLENASPEFKRYRAMWEAVPEQLIMLPFPLHLDIGATSKCNMACPMCTRTRQLTGGDFINVQDFDLALYKRLVDEGIAGGLCALNLDNFGEPLMNPDIYEMVRYAKEKGVLDVMFHSNATFLDEEKGRKLIDAGLDRLIFSFDSPYKERYLKIRIGGSYDTELANIRGFAALKTRLGALRPITRINCIRFPNTAQKDMEDTIALFGPIVDSVSFLDYVDPVKGKSGKYPDGYVSEFVCPQLLTRLTLWEDGQISPCCQDYDHKLTLGTAPETSLQEAWDSPKRKAILAAHLQGKFYLIPACRNCDSAIQGDLEKRAQKEKKSEPA